ncbi:MAG: adenosylcobinamide amidohydrolase [Candidatus Bathyarchaeota archaeon]|nr:adenosylcobinamide amidohydrolase [Candidatus Bathyarchaeota archaeon]
MKQNKPAKQKQDKKITKKRVDLTLEGVKAKVLYLNYDGFDLNTLLVSFNRKRRILSTWDGYRKVKYVANNYIPTKLSALTMERYEDFEKKFPSTFGVKPKDISFLSTGVNMNNLAFCEKSCEELNVCCFATAGAKGNAQRSGVDVGNYFERDGKFVLAPGTINIIILTNAVLSDGAMARAIVTATEAKTAAMEDLKVKSSYAPQIQATGTGSDNMIVVSGNGPDIPLRVTSGHTKIGELIGFLTKSAVTEALKKNDGYNTS